MSHQQEPTPGLVNWTGYLAITFLLVLPAAVLTVRSGAWQQGLLLFAISCAGATIILLLALVMLVLPKFPRWRKAIGRDPIRILPTQQIKVGPFELTLDSECPHAKPPEDAPPE